MHVVRPPSAETPRWVALLVLLAVLAGIAAATWLAGQLQGA
jgi:hypothetical protein